MQTYAIVAETVMFCAQKNVLDIVGNAQEIKVKCESIDKKHKE